MNLTIKAPKEFDISKLNEEQMFHVTLIARFLEQCVEENIITRSQKSEMSKFMLEKMNSKK